jgi:endonuclease/exonuclease/phosphatase family metal-dependent hydrolase
MGDSYTQHYTDLAVPISVHTDYEVIGGGRKKAHDGKAGASPARWVAWVIAQHRVTGEVVVFLNTHFVSGAWNSKPKPHKTWRKHVWTDHWQLLRDLLPTLRQHGPVIVVGDFNRVVVQAFADFAWIDNRGIDKIAANGLTAPAAPRRIVTRSDHDARTVELTKETADVQ